MRMKQALLLKKFPSFFPVVGLRQVQLQRGSAAAVTVSIAVNADCVEAMVDEGPSQTGGPSTHFNNQGNTTLRQTCPRPSFAG